MREHLTASVFTAVTAIWNLKAHIMVSTYLQLCLWVIAELVMVLL
jgi:hypothetical protein